MKPNYCIARVYQIAEGYPAKPGDPKPITLQLTMEPNPYTPSLSLTASFERSLAEGVKVGDRVRLDMRLATDDEFAAFQAAVSTPMAIASK